MNPLDRLKHHVTGAIERGEKEAIVEERPYFAEGTEAMLALEAMIDKVGIANVLYALAHICGAKSEHVATNWQDTIGAKVWAKRAAFFDDKASTILFQEG